MNHGIPRFAVVGHPNKGKSSIVSTLSQDDSIAVSQFSGTTKESVSYPLTIDGKVLYQLIDTPGFQRARAVLEWLSREELSADARPKRVQELISDRSCQDLFPDEISLLTPILNGAGILYIVDGSVPYAKEYEAEMEILRWTGSPAMALINPISGDQYVESWKAALTQYFGLVRVFNPFVGGIAKHQELLRSLVELRSEWRAPLEKAIAALEAQQGEKERRIASLVAAAIAEMLSYTEEKRLAEFEDPENHKPALRNSLIQKIQVREQKLFLSLREIFGLSADWTMPEIEGLPLDESLFSERSWDFFGLSRRDLAVVGALSGGAAGGMIDLGLGGASLFLGSIVGGGLGVFSVLLAAERLVKVRILSLGYGKRKVVAGPIQDINFPFVVLSRARAFVAVLRERSHAQRSSLLVTEDGISSLNSLSREERKLLSSRFGVLIRDPRNFESQRGVMEAIQTLGVQ